VRAPPRRGRWAVGGVPRRHGGRQVRGHTAPKLGVGIRAVELVAAGEGVGILAEFFAVGLDGFQNVAYRFGDRREEGAIVFGGALVAVVDRGGHSGQDRDPYWFGGFRWWLRPIVRGFGLRIAPRGGELLFSFFLVMSWEKKRVWGVSRRGEKLKERKGRGEMMQFSKTKCALRHEWHSF